MEYVRNFDQGFNKPRSFAGRESGTGEKVVTAVMGLFFLGWLGLMFIPFYRDASGFGYTAVMAYTYGDAQWPGVFGAIGAYLSFAALLLLACKSNKKKIVGGYLQMTSLLMMIIFVVGYVNNYPYYYNKLVNNPWRHMEKAFEEWAVPQLFVRGTYGPAFYMLVIMFSVCVVLAIIQTFQRMDNKIIVHYVR